MGNSGNAEFYFITAMMILIVIISTVATYLFFRQYKMEMRDKDKINEQARKQKAKMEERANREEAKL